MDATLFLVAPVVLGFLGVGAGARAIQKIGGGEAQRAMNRRGSERERNAVRRPSADVPLYALPPAPQPDPDPALTWEEPW